MTYSKGPLISTIAPANAAPKWTVSRACVLLCLFILLAASQGSSAVTPEQHKKAATLNNQGVAMMNQQILEGAASKFNEAYVLDPTLDFAQLNKGIALLYLQKTAEAKEALQHAAAVAPQNPHVWYSLGLLYRATSDNENALKSFQRVAEIDSADADTHYFLGTLYQDAHDNEHAEAEFRAALNINPLHASAAFGLARSLQREGKTDEARTYFQRFQHLTQDKISTPLSHTYGEEGKYSLVQEVRGLDPAVSEMIPIVFTPMAGKGAGSTGESSGQQSSGGACMLDLAGSGRPDLIIIGVGQHAIRAYRFSADGGYTLLPLEGTGLDASGTGVSCTVGDFDNDGLSDMAVAMSDKILLFKNLGGGRFADVTKFSGIQPANHPRGMTFVDYDHDGDLDLFVTGSADPALGSATVQATANVLWRNNGNGTFTNWTGPTGLGGDGTTQSVTLSDINNDRAVDLVVTGSQAAPTFYANPREGHFKAIPLYAQSDLSPTNGVVVFDFNKDGWMDVALTHAGSPGVTLWRNIDGKRFERVPLPIQDATAGWGLSAVDIDNDGWIDLAAIVETKSGPQLRVLRNLGPKGFEDITSTLKLDRIALKNPRALIAADVDRDGDADLIVTQLGEAPLVLRNDGGNRNHSLRLTLKGLADNKSAIGTKVEVFADGLWQKWEVAGASGYMSQGASSEILVGTGKADRIDNVRMLWPTGVPQDETDIATKSSVTVTELDRRGSSCPTLFAWDGKKYGFITDVIGAGVVGHWVSPVARNTPDPDEWVKIEGSQLKPRNGYLSLRFGEPMEEVNFLDQVRLVAVDHPAGSEVYPNERFLSEPPFAEEKVIVSSSAHLPMAAWDDKGRNAMNQLRYRDHKFLIDFQNLPFAGFANIHSLTLDIGNWTATNPLRLLLHGFVEYFSASSMYAAWQAGITPVPPYVEAQLPDGTWRKVVEDMGFPAGLQRTIVADLTGKLPIGTQRIRITTNLQIYWDQILVDNEQDAPGSFRLTELPLASAQLAFRGYPQQLDGKTSGDLTYNYQQMSLTGPFAHARGSLTHYGDVTPLLKSIDDTYVIFGSGEDIDIEFQASALLPLPKGWKRDYFFYANGFVKDMDFYEASPFTVADMPFHGMSSYPYAEGDRSADDRSQMKYELEWNDRFDPAANAADYKFRYKPVALQPLQPAADSASR